MTAIERRRYDDKRSMMKVEQKQADFDAFNARSIYNALTIVSCPKADLTNPEEVRDRIMQYFVFCADNGMKCSVAGIAASLGLNERRLSEARKGQIPRGFHEKVPKETLDMIDDAYNIYEMYLEDLMLSGKANYVGAMFIMKCNCGYKEYTGNDAPASDPLGEIEDAETIAKRYENIID